MQNVPQLYSRLTIRFTKITNHDWGSWCSRVFHLLGGQDKRIEYRVFWEESAILWGKTGDKFRNNQIGIAIFVSFRGVCIFISIKKALFQIHIILQKTETSYANFLISYTLIKNIHSRRFYD